MAGVSPLHELDYSVLQQCMHCGMCLPTCPTYVETKNERNSPRGRIALMRSIADGKLEPTKVFGDEMYFCLGCLACETACPAGVDYTHLFESARSEAERSGQLRNPWRDSVRAVVLGGIFMRPRVLRFLGRLLWFFRASGIQWLIRTFHLTALLPRDFRRLERQTPPVRSQFSHQLIQPVETTKNRKWRVGLLTGCVQDLVFSDVNRATAEVLLANNCEVVTPPVQYCCGSLHGHNGEMEMAKDLARRNLDSFDLGSLDAIITNAAGCGSHLRHYDRLLEDDPIYSARAAEWSRKAKDIHEWLVEIGFRVPVAPASGAEPLSVTYHEACHLCHGQKITKQPREILKSIPGLQLTELAESTWCCGSAGIYNITQPEMAAKLQDRKMGHIRATGAEVAATANPGCHLQLVNGAGDAGFPLVVKHPVQLLADAYRNEAAVLPH